ncbi:uncharacterized protein C8Q71DRAFT_855738 [Rhodofomes roseus]|uniref:Uncharacterized protein n=1 Tax=Rhodofomes roseus TaxID=34475 RepID=A0ABQ8KMS0_9APHY|nr:uncharacterized protein C8Q71DRAFT_855738 [Rhodofomes roseus]KAH9839091.1 hypothetical protein C8Q71DRAFT_855738 [Rhodofomes roseus]
MNSDHQTTTFHGESVPTHNATATVASTDISHSSTVPSSKQASNSRYLAHPPGIPIPLARMRGNVYRRLKHPPGIPIPLARMQDSAYQRLDHPPGIPFPLARIQTYASQHSRDSSTSSWSTQTYTTKSNHSQAQAPLQQQGRDTLATDVRVVPPPFPGGAILNPIWVNTPRVGLGHVERTDTKALEPFRVPRGAVLNPTWVDTSRVGLGQVSGGRADLEPFRTKLADQAWPGLSKHIRPTMGTRIVIPTSPKYDYGQSDDYDWAVALSTYDSLNIEEGKHARDFFSQWQKDSELFGMWKDEWGRQARATEGVFEGEPELLMEQHLDEMPSLLFLSEERSEEGAGGSPSNDVSMSPTSPLLDDIIPGMVGLGDQAKEQSAMEELIELVDDTREEWSEVIC